VLKIHVDGALKEGGNFWASSGYLVGEKAE